MAGISRRNVITSAAAGGLMSAAGAHAASFGNPDEPPQGAVNAKNTGSLTDPGPRNPPLANQFPAAVSPPPTDVGDMPLFWASFNDSPRRIQDGGWARQVTQAQFQISTTFSGVDMRLSAGGIRELHWHLASEWGYVTYGSCRVTVLDPAGHAYVADVKTGDIWYFPSGFPHSIQGLAPDGCEFLLAFDQGGASEFNTLLVTDWLAHTPPDILSENFGVPVDAFSRIPLHNLWIFQGQVPGPLTADQAAVKAAGDPPQPFTFALSDEPFAKQTKGGTVKIIDSSKFTVSTTTAAALVTLKPGGLREMHWHPNADEWQYYIKGAAQMTVFGAAPRAVTQNFEAGDIGYVLRDYGHYVKNVGNTDLQFLEIFRSAYYSDISLSDWLANTPPAMVEATLNVTPQTISRWPKNKPVVMPV